MTNSFFNFNEAADFASQLQDSYDDLNRSYDRREQLERDNDRTREINAAMPMKMIESLADFSISVKKASDARKEKEWENFHNFKYNLNDEKSEQEAINKVNFTKDQIPSFNKAQKTALNNKDAEVLPAFDVAPQQQFKESRRVMQGVIHSVPELWATKGWKQAHEAATTIQEKNKVVADFKNSVLQSLFKQGHNERLVKRSVGRKIDDLRKTVYKTGSEEIIKRADAEFEAGKNKDLMAAIDPNNVDYTVEDYKKEYSFGFDNGMGGVQHDMYDRGIKIAKVTGEISTDQLRMLLKADAGGMPYDERFPVIAGERYKELKEIDEEQATADKTASTQAYNSQNQAALDNARQQLLDGVDPEIIKRDLNRVQANNKLVFSQFGEYKGIENFIEGMSISTAEFLKYDAEFEFQYGKGKLTVKEIEDLDNPDLTKKWLSRAQAQEKARTGSNYKDSKNSVEQLVKSADKIWGKQSRGTLLPEANAVRGHLVQKFEEEFTKLTDANDPNAAVNAALNVQAYFNANGGGEPDNVVGKKLFSTTDQIFKNYVDSLKTSTIEVNPKAAIEFDIQSATTKINMLNNDVQKALDTPNVFLNESEVKYEIERLINREGYSPKLKVMSARFGKHFAVGGPRGILERQAAVYGIPKEQIPPEYDSIAKIYSKGNPLINCLISEKGFEGLSSNQLLRQCSAISKDGVDDKDLKDNINLRPAFQTQ
jgi:hypothetical protein